MRTRNISLAIKRLENKASENLTNGAEKNVSEDKNAARLDARCFDSATQKQVLYPERVFHKSYNFVRT